MQHFWGDLQAFSIDTVPFALCVVFGEVFRLWLWLSEWVSNTGTRLRLGRLCTSLLLSALSEQISSCCQLAFQLVLLMIWHFRQHVWEIVAFALLMVSVVLYCDVTSPFLILHPYHISQLASWQQQDSIPRADVICRSLLSFSPSIYPSPFSGFLSKWGLVLGGEWSGWSSSGRGIRVEWEKQCFQGWTVFPGERQFIFQRPSFPLSADASYP